MKNIQKPNSTKIVITVGPATDSREMLTRLIDAGVDVFRVNTSHGNIDKHLETINLIRTISNEKNCNIPVMVDLQGPKIRLGEFSPPLLLEDGQEIILSTAEKTEKTHIPVDYKNITNDVKINDDIFINDGKVRLRAISIEYDRIVCRVINGGEISSRKGINLPGAEVSTPAITERDKQFMEFAVKNDVSYLALSFVRSEEDIIEAKQILKNLGKSIPIIAKIEKPQALDRIDAIIKEADGIMVARGDLGIELSPEKVPLAQKMIVKKANIAQKPVIIATQMLESMINDPIPTRAEANDVANSILDGADAIMLSGETSIGKFPIQAVAIMEKIAAEIEQSTLYYELLKNMLIDPKDRSITTNQDIIISSLFNDLDIKAVVAITESGYTASVLSTAKIRFPIIALSNHLELCKALSLLWGILPVFHDITNINLEEDGIAKLSGILTSNTFLNKGDQVLFVAGLPYLNSEKTTKMRLFTL
ncbi:MAG: pyruvate kinase [Candidatus Margulisbacteria bacterium]|nr:pyruvate kinase [Candidatus Margulisiibacteriota bacterium]